MVHFGSSPVKEENNVNILSTQTFVLISMSVVFAECLNVNIPSLFEIMVVKYLGIDVNYWRLKVAEQPFVYMLWHENLY